MTFRTTQLFDPLRRVIAVVDSNDNRTTTVYSPAGRPIAEIDALGRRTTQAWDPVFNRVAVVDANGNRNSFVYDEVDNEIVRIAPLGSRTTFAYDSARRRTRRVDARGHITSYVHDDVGRMIERRYPDGTRATFSYDPVGNRTLMANEAGVTTVAFDALNRAWQTLHPNDKIVTYSFDSVGRRHSMIEPDGGRFTYNYDPAGRIAVLDNPFNERTTFQYDDASQRTAKLLANGARTSFSYDEGGRMERVAHLKSDSTTISSFKYALDPVGNRTRVVEADGSVVTWTYDDRRQLINEQRSGPDAYDTTHTYDPVGNRVVKLADGLRTSYAYNTANQLQQSEDAAGLTTYSFDSDGNQTATLEPTGELTTAVWDYENRRTLLQLPSGARNTATYDADGLRVKLHDSSGDKKFIWDNRRLLMEVTDADVTEAIYTNEPAHFGNLVSQRRSGVSFYHAFDALGSTVQLLDGSESGVNQYVYDAFGTAVSAVEVVANPFRFVGMLGYYFDAESGEVYVRARYYDPRIIRWTSVDPIPDERFARYVYASNNPIRHSDASGMAVTTDEYVFSPRDDVAPTAHGYTYLPGEGSSVLKAIRVPGNADIECTKTSRDECCGDYYECRLVRPADFRLTIHGWYSVLPYEGCTRSQQWIDALIRHEKGHADTIAHAVQVWYEAYYKCYVLAYRGRGCDELTARSAVKFSESFRRGQFLGNFSGNKVNEIIGPATDELHQNDYFGFSPGIRLTEGNPCMLLPILSAQEHDDRWEARGSNVLDKIICPDNLSVLGGTIPCCNANKRWTRLRPIEPCRPRNCTPPHSFKDRD